MSAAWSMGEKIALGVVAVGTVVLVRAAWKVRGVPTPLPSNQQLATTIEDVAVQQAALALL